MAYTHAFHSLLVKHPHDCWLKWAFTCFNRFNPDFLASSDFISPFSLANLPLVCWLMFQPANLSTCSVYCWGCHPRSLLVHWAHTVLSAPRWQNISVFCLLLRFPVHFCKQMSLLGNNFMKQLGEHIIHIIYFWNISTNPLFLLSFFTTSFLHISAMIPRSPRDGARPVLHRRDAAAGAWWAGGWLMDHPVKRPRVGISSLEIGILTTKSW